LIDSDRPAKSFQFRLASLVFILVPLSESQAINTMFGLGLPELVIVCIVALLLFGNRLPSVARSLGRSMTEFKKGMNEGEQTKAVEDQRDR
jgi:TatA/E family protein of Tat protein translocase